MDGPVPTGDAPHPFFHFRVGGVLFVCPAKMIEAVTACEQAVPLPRVPAHVRGLVTYDQRALVVVDLAAFLGLGSSACDEPSAYRTLVVSCGPYRVGLPVESAIGVVTLADDALTPPSGVFTGRLAEYVTGEVATPDGLSGVLDLERLLEAARV